MKFNIKLLYLYLFSFIGLLITIIGAVQLVDLSLRTYIFKGADYFENVPRPDVGKKVEEIDQEKEVELQRKNNSSQKQRQASTAVAQIIVGIPLYLYHWGLIKKNK